MSAATRISSITVSGEFLEPALLLHQTRGRLGRPWRHGVVRRSAQARDAGDRIEAAEFFAPNRFQFRTRLCPSADPSLAVCNLIGGPVGQPGRGRRHQNDYKRIVWIPDSYWLGM